MVSTSPPPAPPSGMSPPYFHSLCFLPNPSLASGTCLQSHHFQTDLFHLLWSPHTSLLEGVEHSPYSTVCKWPHPVATRPLGSWGATGQQDSLRPASLTPIDTPPHPCLLSQESLQTRLLFVPFSLARAPTQLEGWQSFLTLGPGGIRGYGDVVAHGGVKDGGGVDQGRPLYKTMR